ncbi:MAG: carboxymuconolactone decarboxylase family protein [Pseudacidovorax sp.]|nr:carboxymuconolactone decarboxylase family protein [Pseudacidovorax sp.]
MTHRMEPATAPFHPDVAPLIERIMNGQTPLHLFRVLARDGRLAKKFFSAGLLDKGHLSLKERELVIDRTTALCRSEYEWGVHVTVFGQAAGLTAEQIHSTVAGGADDACWTDEDRMLIHLCDALHHECDIGDGLWTVLKARFSDEALMELVMLAGFYRTVSYLTNAFRMPLEPGMARFPR